MAISSRNALFLIFLALFGACSDESDKILKPPVTEFPPLSKVFFVAGSVSGEDDGKTIECYCDLRIELSEEPDGYVGRSYEGFYGGGLGRTILAPDGSGISLHPDVAGDVVVRILSVDSVELYFPANEAAEGRFWANLVRFRGSWTDDSQLEGQWLCAPFDINEGGWIDTIGTASGKWSIIPE